MTQGMFWNVSKNVKAIRLSINNANNSNISSTTSKIIKNFYIVAEMARSSVLGLREL